MLNKERGFITKINNLIPENARYIMFNLMKYGKQGNETYLVGGCVRDILLNRKPKDWDICTILKPNEMIEIMKIVSKRDNKNIEIIPTGLKHGTVTFVIDKEPYEVTTFRYDGKYSDNRRPDNVVFVNSIAEDLKRRDFTINAIAYHMYQGFLDPFNGIQDLKDKVIKCVGSAKDRFNEDALRILRAIRFASQLGFAIMSETDWEIHQQYENLKNISIERINSELCKIATSEDFCVQLLLYKDIFSLFIPELKPMFNFQQNNPYHIWDVYEHTIHAIEYCDVNNSNDLIIKLATLFHDIGKPHCYEYDKDGIIHFKGHGRVSADITKTIMKRMKFDNETINQVVELIYYHDSTFGTEKKHIKRWLNKIGETQFKRLLELRKADISAQNPDYLEERIKKVSVIEKVLKEVLAENECFKLKDVAINGNDLKDIGFKEGKTIGIILNDVLNSIIEEQLNNNKEEILTYVKEKYKK